MLRVAVIETGGAHVYVRFAPQSEREASKREASKRGEKDIERIYPPL
jgi:Ethanolamine utilization protein EutJ (predicted chaperonin)